MSFRAPPFLSAPGLAALAGAVLAAFPGAPAMAQASTDTVAAIRSRGQLVCGVAGQVAGFSLPDSRGEMRGIDADSCRAVAAAIFGDAGKVRFVATTPQNRFTALQSGEIDMLVRNTTWTLSREASLGLEFATINMYDGQGFMVKRASSVTSAKDLGGASICVQPGTTTELNMTDYFRSQNLPFTPVVIETVEEVQKAFISGRCDAYTTDTSSLASFRATQGPDAGKYLLLPEIISKEPLGAVIRKGDFKFFDIVRWAHFAQLTAEELGITSQNISSFEDSNNPDVQRFMGKSGDLGKMMGLSPDWAVRLVRQVGNYGEVWNRNITPLGIQRGINNLWTKGGLQYAPPMR
ncbi:amino acid ABC transporter substrate-binding protein [Roseomonas marmotae]|uniref:Amino acid ABC transporter substrate-binding protein n=1 Tax=Roseomonas marmotae TaxID=2768161 RepID=A0ABS3K7G8_9PROT|nr:amino acid ABC transporter substrate-binding protein [Roseomonas marmotae]MBO1073402.1 amino acid ABC transporter substrate-binding protein [Roseomonas marmotae]QTI80400.1 amino acid ABC transporter substrate-binding protein [Roseomonas marmotae]